MPLVRNDPLASGEMRKLTLPNGPGTLIVYESLFSPDGSSGPLRLQVNVDAGIIDAVLRTGHVVTVEPDIADRARGAIERMVEIT